MTDDVWVRLTPDEVARLPWIGVDPERATDPCEPKVSPDGG